MPSRAELEAAVRSTNVPPTSEDPLVATLLPGANVLTLMIRVYYGGRKGRAAQRKLRRGVPCALVFDDGTIAEILYRVK